MKSSVNQGGGYGGYLTNLKRAEQWHPNETELGDIVIRPFLINELSYPEERIRREEQHRNLRPDFTCYDEDGNLDLIVEVKALGVDLNKRAALTAAETTIPHVQIQKYLKLHEKSSSRTLGLLVNGRDIQLYLRTERDVELIRSQRIDSDRDVNKITKAIAVRRSQIPDESSGVSHSKTVFDLLDKLSLEDRPEQLIEEIRVLFNLSGVSSTDENRASARLTLTSTRKSGEELFPQRHLCVFRSFANDGQIAVKDIQYRLYELGWGNSNDRIVGLFTTKAPDSNFQMCRIFTFHSSKLRVSAMFNPTLPGKLVLDICEQILEWSQDEEVQFVPSLDVGLLHEEFYNDMAKWFENTPKTRNYLRHLIKILFVWFLKERAFVPSEYFEHDPNRKTHKRINELFGLLATPNRERTKVLGEDYTELEKRVPFINGSLFDRDEKLRSVSCSEKQYHGVGDNPGILTILKRYDWTHEEPSPFEESTSLDPSLLGSVFERLMVVSEGVEKGPDARMPFGTYYTPQDITEEMVIDALAHSLNTSLEVPVDQAMDLFSPSLELHKKIRKTDRIMKFLEELDVLDPCVGSGQFIMTMLNVLRRSARKLKGPSYDDSDRIRLAIEKQLYAADIHPVAVQITQLRLFIALIGNQQSNPISNNEVLQPLPNLHVRIGTVDSLATSFTDGYTGEIKRTNKVWRNWQALRDEYIFAHSSSLRRNLRRKEQDARDAILNSSFSITPRLKSWLNKDSLSYANEPAFVDLRSLFGKESWSIVIGNPPYVRSNRDGTIAQQAKIHGYATWTCGNEYTLFVELAVKLADPEKGVVTMIVPNSIGFSQSTKKLRAMIESHCQNIDYRTYDNRPQAVFPPHPFVKDGNQAAENRQRVTVFSLVTGTRPTKYVGSGLIRLSSDNRASALQYRTRIKQRHDSGWTIAPTDLLMELYEQMVAKASYRSSRSKSTKIITFPTSAYFYITCLPDGLLANPAARGELSVPSDGFYWPRICLYNSHLLHAYWLMTGSAFSLTKAMFEQISYPDSWESNSRLRTKAESVGKKLARKTTIKKCATTFNRKDKIFENCDFHTYVPELIEEADRACIRAYGMQEDEEELLRQLRHIRRGSAHNILKPHLD